MHFHEHAFKHGFTEDDIRHVLAHARKVVALDDERTLVIGPDRAVRFLQVIVVQLDDDDEPTVIHAMELQPRNRRYLTGELL